MRVRRVFAAAVVVALVVGAALVTGAGAPPRAKVAPAPLRVYAAQFPPGPGQAIADRSCTACHSPTLITQQAKDSTAWEKTLTQMAKWGVELTPGERDTLRTYLVTRYGRQ